MARLAGKAIVNGARSLFDVTAPLLRPVKSPLSAVGITRNIPGF